LADFEIMDVCKTAEESAQSANMLPDYYISFWHALCHGQTPQQSLNCQVTFWLTGRQCHDGACTVNDNIIFTNYLRIKWKI